MIVPVACLVGMLAMPTNREGAGLYVAGPIALAIQLPISVISLVIGETSD